jgi:hypothetical protein
MITSDTAAETEGKVPFINQPTHGKSGVNVSEPMHTTTDVFGKNIPQRSVYPKTHIWIDKDYLDKAIPGSVQYQTQDEVRKIWSKNKASRYSFR